MERTPEPRIRDLKGRVYLSPTGPVRVCQACGRAILNSMNTERCPYCDSPFRSGSGMESPQLRL